MAAASAARRIAEIIREAATLASEKREQHGLPPLPRTTPHSLRRTYISIALLANNFDVKWVMSQVGHADSKMTLDVYAQLEQRIKREHGVRFDAVIRAAEEQMHGDDMSGEDPAGSDASRSASERDEESTPPAGASSSGSPAPPRPERSRPSSADRVRGY